MSLGPLRLALLGLLAAVSVAAQSGGPGFSIPGYNEIQNNKTPVLPRRQRLNFVNGGCVDDVANASTDCTMSTGGGTGVPGGTVAGAVQYRVNGTTFGGDDNVLDDGAGTVTGKFRDKGGAVFNVRAYGAVGDAVTDDSAAIQAAITAAGAGGTIWFPVGYYMAVNLAVQQGQVFRGEGTCDITLGGNCGAILQPPSFCVGGTNPGTACNPNNGAPCVAAGGTCPRPGSQTILKSNTPGATDCKRSPPFTPKCADGVRFENLVLIANGDNDLVLDLTNMNETMLDGLRIYGRKSSGATGQTAVRQVAVNNGGTPTGGVVSHVENTRIANFTTAFRQSMGTAAEIGPNAHILSNTIGVQIDGRCTNSGCTGAGTGVLNFCTSDADCAGCGGGAGSCSNNNPNTGGSENNIHDSVLELNDTNILNVGSFTKVLGNHIENGSGTATQVDERGIDTVYVGNSFFTNVSAPSIRLTPVSAAPVATRVDIRDNGFSGGGNYVTEANASLAVEVGRNLYHGVGAKVTPTSGSGVRWVDTVEGSTVASLPAVAVGSVLFATNGTNSDPCSTTGEGPQGVLAFRVGVTTPRWSCAGYLRGLGAGAANLVGVWSDPNTLTSFPLFVFDGTSLAIGSTTANGGILRTVGSTVFHDFYNASPNVSPPQIVGRHAHGAEATPTHILSGELLATFGGRAYPQGVCQFCGGGCTNGVTCEVHTDCPTGLCSNNQAFESGSPAKVDLYASQDHTTTQQGTEIHLAATLNGATTVCDKLIVRNSGALSIFTPQTVSTCNATTANSFNVTPTTYTAQRNVTAPNVGGTFVVTPTATDGQMDWSNLANYPNGTGMTGGACTTSGQAVTTLADGPTCGYTEANALRETGGPTDLTIAAIVNGQCLVRSGTTITSQACTATHTLLDGVVHTDTAAGTVARGDLVTGQTATPKWTRLPLGTVGKVVRSDGTDALYSTFTIPDTYVLGDTLFASAANVLTALAGNTTATRKFLRQTGTGAVSAAPVWDTLLAADVPGSALTKTDDTNVTLTFGGTPSTALLAATSLTLGWTGQLSPARGGAGANNTATLGRYLRGDGTNFVTSSVAAGGAGDCSGTSTFVRATNDNAAPTCSKVTLNTDTSGNYVGTLACGTGVTGCTGAIPAAAPTVGFDYTATLAGNPTLSAGQCVFSNDTSGTNKGGLICEGSGTDANEVYIGVADPTADRTITFPDASGTVAVSSSQTNNALVKYSGTGGQVAPAGCTESANLISGCNLSGTATGLNCTGCVGPTEIASTAVTAGSYGSASLIPVITVDADGRLTAASTAVVVSGFPSSHGISTLGTVAVNTTTYMAESVVDPLESHAQQYVNSTRTIGGFGCVNPVAQGTGANHDIVVTLDTSACVTGTSNLTASTRTCTLTGAASGPQTCTSVNGSISVTAANCMAFKVVSQSAVAAAAVVNCTYDYTG